MCLVSPFSRTFLALLTQITFCVPSRTLISGLEIWTTLMLRLHRKELSGSKKVIGFLSSHGGAGSTTLACMLARRLTSTAPAHSVALMDCDPLSAGIESWCGVDTSGINWADLDEKVGVLVPGQLAKALPRRKTLHVLSADERGGMPLSNRFG